jgi:hypothetical protein
MLMWFETGRDIREKIRREQMENNEFKRRELAALEYNLLRGRARLKAIAEEKRKRQEYEIQLRHLFPPPGTETPLAATVEESTSDLDGRRLEDPISRSRGKHKEPVDPDIISPAPPLTTSGTLNTILLVASSSSTEGPAVTSGIPSPPSSTSTPPSLTGKTNSRIRRTKTLERHQTIPITGEKYRVRAIPPWFLVDSSCTAYATPVPDLKHVMELGVLHLASGGIMKRDVKYHKDCCTNWPLPTTSEN